MIFYNSSYNYFSQQLFLNDINTTNIKIVMALFK